MALWFDGISITVEIAFATTPLATTPTWVDVTEYVRDVPSVSRGRHSEYSHFSPGSCQIVLDNRDRRFDPDYTSGAYYPNVLPMKRVKITWAIGGSSGLVFTGFVMDWPQEERIPSDGYSRVTAVDGSRFVENSPLSASAYHLAVTNDAPDYYWGAQDVLTPAGRMDPDVGSVALGGYGSSGASGVSTLPIGAASTAVVPDYGQGWSSDQITAPLRAVEFWVDGASPTFQIDARTTRYDDFLLFVSAGQIHELRYSNNADSDSAIHNVTTGDDPIRLPFVAGGNHVVVWALAGVSLFVAVNGVTAYTFNPLGTGLDYGTVDPFVSITQTDTGVSHLALYGTAAAPQTGTEWNAHYVAGLTAFGHPFGETGGARITRALDDAGWSPSLRSIDAGQTPQGPYEPGGQRLMEYLRSVERSEQGLVFFDVAVNLNFVDRQALWKLASAVTFTDDGGAGDAKYTDQVRGSHHDTIRNIVTTSYASTGGITRRDSTSITNYGEAAELIQCPTIATAEIASSLSAYVLRQQKDPATRISRLTVPIRVSGGDNEAAKVLALDIGSKVTVERTPMGVGSQVVKTLLVQGIRHSIRVDQWVTTLYLSPAPASNTDSPYLTIGDATLGKVGVTASNLISF